MNYEAVASETCLQVYAMKMYNIITLNAHSRQVIAWHYFIKFEKPLSERHSIKINFKSKTNLN